MNFCNLSQSDLIQQRQNLKEAEQAFKNQKRWIQQREEIEKAITQLKEEIEKDFYRKYQKQEFEEKTIQRFQQVLEEKNRQLCQYIQALQKIDEQLDHSEDLTQETLLQQRIQLLHCIWTLDPTKKEKQETQWKQWNRLRILEIELLGIEKILESLVEHLSIAIQARQSIKGRGILNYIFGLSPNIVIEYQLLGIQSVISNATSLFEKIFQQNPPQSIERFLQDLLTWLEQLKNNCRQSWNFRYLDILFSKIEPTLKQFLTHFKQQQSQLILEIQLLDEEIEHWIKQL